MDDRRDRVPEGAHQPDEAVFNVGRVANGSRGRPVFAAFAVALVLGGLVIAGTFDGPNATAVADPSPATAPTRAAAVQAPTPTAGAIERVDLSLLTLHTRAWGRFVFVHGEVFTRSAEVVIVSIRNGEGQTLDSQTVSMPGGSTALRLGASDRFQLAFEVEGTAASTVSYVLANAYDHEGTPIAAERQSLDPPFDPGYWRSEAGGTAGRAPAAVPIVATEPGGDMALHIRRLPDAVLVHGDLYLAGVTWVFVNMVNSDGRIAGWRTVSIPSGYGEAGESQARTRFDIEVAVPEWSHGPLWVQATAYDEAGFVAAEVQLGVWPDGSAMVGGHDRADVDGPDMATVPEASLLAPDPVSLESPALGATITDGAVTVRGRLQIKADSVRIALLTADRRVLDARTIETANADGGIRPLHAPTFDLRLGVGNPRPVDARLWVVITAFDEAGTVVGFARREVTIGELERPGPW